MNFPDDPDKEADFELAALIASLAGSLGLIITLHGVAGKDLTWKSGIEITIATFTFIPAIFALIYKMKEFGLKSFLSRLTAFFMALCTCAFILFAFLLLFKHNVFFGLVFIVWLCCVVYFVYRRSARKISKLNS